MNSPLIRRGSSTRRIRSHCSPVGGRFGSKRVVEISPQRSNASSLALDAVIDAAFAGRVGELETQFGKARSAGNPPGRILAAALGQVGQLHRARAAMEAGASLEAVVAAITPKAHFRRKAAVE